MQNKLINIAFRWSSTVLLLSLVFLLVACKKYLEPEFKTQILTSDIFANDQNAQSAINGLYINMATVYSSFNVNVTRLGGFASDELTYLNQSDFDNQFMNNQINTTNSSVKSFWDDFYKIIYQCNSIIENSKASTGMSPSYKKQIIGEAMFFRAFSHFYLVNFFGPVPAITSTDKNITAYLPRTSVDSVYTQIKTDLIGAMDSLRADYSISGGNRVRANKWAAAALLARVYLYQKDWADAEATSSALLGNALYSLLPAGSIKMVFKKNQTESILEWVNDARGNTTEGNMFVGDYASYINDPILAPIAGLFLYYFLQPNLINSFEPKDQRLANWVIITSTGKGAPYKYRRQFGLADSLNDEHYSVLRLAEQYLIRAEARAQQGNFNGAQSDINVIRNRAGLPDAVVVDKISAMTAIEQERRVELFCEWAHRWFDLKRWPSLVAADKTRADDVLSLIKPGWKSTNILLPIPQADRRNNTNLTQNPGYPQ